MQHPHHQEHSVDLHGVVDKLWEAAIAPRTRLVYETGFNAYVRFLLLYGILTQLERLQAPPKTCCCCSWHIAVKR